MRNILNVKTRKVNEIEDWKQFFKFEGISNKKRTRFYNKNFLTFDIETTALKDIKQSFMYIWQMYNGDECIIGRTWKEFEEVMWQLHRITEGHTTVIYVHFLSHEFQYLSGIYDFRNEDIFYIDPRKILRCMMLGNIEFRCSYMLSNMGLKNYTEKMNVLHKKMSGDLDYSIIRTATSELTDVEMGYCVNDVVGLHEAITKQFEMEGDDVISTPLTSTGYPRRDSRKALYKYKNTLVYKIFPDIYTYRLLREAFRGGNTHANRFYAGAILDNVKSVDIKSSYPSSLTRQFPMTRFKRLEGNTHDIEHYIMHGYACLGVIVMENVRLRNPMWGCPYLPIDKCRGVTNKVLDNGRILSADMLQITVTDIDYKIIMEEYKCDRCVCTCLEIAQYGELPKEFLDVVLNYFKTKTELDGVEEQKVFYDKAKEKLNSVAYGMMVQNPVKEKYAYNGGLWDEVEIDESEELFEFKKTAFLPYQWGVWVAAWGRWQLEQSLKIEPENFVYCDTDSKKYIGGSKDDMHTYNMEALMAAENANFYAQAPNGEIKYMGLYEYEFEYEKFITWGAKKYAYIGGKQAGKLGITIAGVSKKAGAKEVEERGGLKALKPGFIFRNSAGAEFRYNDKTYGWYSVNGERVFITKNLYSEESTYELTITEEYKEILKKASILVPHLLKNY